MDLTSEDGEAYQQAMEAIDADPAHASDALNELAQRYPGNPGIWINLGIARYSQGNFASAQEALDKANRIDETIAEGYNLEGLIAIQQYRFVDAEQAFQKALALDKTFALAHYNLGLVYDLYFQQVDKAVSHYEQYVSAVPDDKETAAWVAHLRRSLEQR